MGRGICQNLPSKKEAKESQGMRSDLTSGKKLPKVEAPALVW